MDGRLPRHCNHDQPLATSSGFFFKRTSISVHMRCWYMHGLEIIRFKARNTSSAQQRKADELKRLIVMIIKYKEAIIHKVPSGRPLFICCADAILAMLTVDPKFCMIQQHSSCPSRIALWRSISGREREANTIQGDPSACTTPAKDPAPVIDRFPNPDLSKFPI